MFLCNQKCVFAASKHCYRSFSGNFPWIWRGEKSSSRIKMPKHAYTNNNYCFQEREEAKQTNVKRETTYWATSQPFSAGGRGGGGVPASCSTGYYEPFVCLTSHFCNHVRADFSRGAKRRSFCSVSLCREKKRKKKEKKTMCSQRVRRQKIKFRLLCLFAIVLFFAMRMHLIKVTSVFLFFFFLCFFWFF